GPAGRQRPDVAQRHERRRAARRRTGTSGDRVPRRRAERGAARRARARRRHRRPAGRGAAMIERRHGPLAAGDLVQLTDTKGRMHTIELVPGKDFHTHRGVIAHDDLIGQPEGCVVTSLGGTAYVAFRPLLSDYVLSMPRGATVVYPKDAAQIVALADIFPGARVVEAGAGSGALSCSLLRAVGEQGLVSSYEMRDDFAAVAQRNVHRFFGEAPATWRLTVGDVVEKCTDTEMDRVILDLLAPWDVLETAAT